MKTGNPTEVLASALYSALFKDLDPIQYIFNPPKRIGDKEGKIKQRRPTKEDVEVYHFPQTWPSTALGFTGIGADSMTKAYTTVISCANNTACVYFNGIYAYSVEISKVFFADVCACNVEGISGSIKYQQQ